MGFFYRYHYNFTIFEKYHYYSPIWKHTIIILFSLNRVIFYVFDSVGPTRRSLKATIFSYVPKYPYNFSLPPLADVWAPHANFSFILQPMQCLSARAQFAAAPNPSSRRSSARSHAAPALSRS
jgi:hypothetical protein